MPTQCLQSLDNGEQCKAPAVLGSKFCRHHDPHRDLGEERKLKLRQKQPFTLPDFNDNAGIVAAVKAVLNALADRRIKRSEADTFIHGLKFSAKLMAEFGQAGGTFFPAFLGHPMEQPPLRADDDVWEPTLCDIDEFNDTIQNGTPDELIGQIVEKQKAWIRNRAQSTQPQPVEHPQPQPVEHPQPRPVEHAEPQPVTRRPSNQALARLAAAGNQKAAQFLAAHGISWHDRNQPGSATQASAQSQ